MNRCYAVTEKMENNTLISSSGKAKIQTSVHADVSEIAVHSWPWCAA